MPATNFRRAQRRRRYASAVQPRQALAQRVVAPIGRGAHVPYAVPVATEIDRGAWAKLLAQLIQDETSGNKTLFASVVGVDRKTITRWATGQVAVSEESVRTVARKLGISARDMLVRVGYYGAAELTEPTPVEVRVTQDDAAIRLIRASDAPPSLKRELIQHLKRQREEHERQRLAEAERLLKIGMRRVG